MKALVYVGPEKVEIQELPDPLPEPGEVLLRVSAAGICGSDVCPEWRLFGMDRLHGTYAELVSVPARQLHPLSETLPETEAVLIEPLAVLIHASS